MCPQTSYSDTEYLQLINADTDEREDSSVVLRVRRESDFIKKSVTSVICIKNILRVRVQVRFIGLC